MSQQTKEAPVRPITTPRGFILEGELRASRDGRVEVGPEGLENALADALFDGDLDVRHPADMEPIGPVRLTLELLR